MIKQCSLLVSSWCLLRHVMGNYVLRWQWNRISNIDLGNVSIVGKQLRIRLGRRQSFWRSIIPHRKRQSREQLRILELWYGLNLVYICVHNASGFAGIVVGSGLINLDLMRDLALATRDGSRARVRVCHGLNGIYLPFRIRTICAHIQEAVFHRDVY